VRGSGGSWFIAHGSWPEDDEVAVAVAMAVCKYGKSKKPSIG